MWRMFFTRFELLDCKRFGILFDSPLDSPTSSGGDSGRVSPEFEGGGGATSLLSSRVWPNSNRRNRTLSMNLENFQDPIWRQTGRDLQVHKNNFNPLRKLLTFKPRILKPVDWSRSQPHVAWDACCIFFSDPCWPVRPVPWAPFGASAGRGGWLHLSRQGKVHRYASWTLQRRTGDLIN